MVSKKIFVIGLILALATPNLQVLYAKKQSSAPYTGMEMQKHLKGNMNRVAIHEEQTDKLSPKMIQKPRAEMVQELEELNKKLELIKTANENIKDTQAREALNAVYDYLHSMSEMGKKGLEGIKERMGKELPERDGKRMGPDDIASRPEGQSDKMEKPQHPEMMHKIQKPSPEMIKKFEELNQKLALIKTTSEKVDDKQVSTALTTVYDYLHSMSEMRKKGFENVKERMGVANQGIAPKKMEKVFRPETEGPLPE